VSPFNLETVDVDGAVREMAAEAGIDRAGFIKKGAIAGGGILVGSAIFDRYLDPAQAAISKKHSASNDVKILNYALTLEYLEAAFYAQAVANNAFSSDQFRLFGTTVAGHEAKHVEFLRGVIPSSKRVKKPAFDFGDAVKNPQTFAATAQVLEDTGVSAYLGQVGNIKQAVVLKAAASVVTVEARHAAWIRTLNADPANLPAPASFDTAKSEAAVLKAVTGTGFIKG
jgi:hypothetical protein